VSEETSRCFEGIQMQICLESNTLSKEQQLLKFEDLDGGR
jgi:hypothetical protein